MKEKHQRPKNGVQQPISRLQQSSGGRQGGVPFKKSLVNVALPLSLVIIGIIAYANSFNGPFIFDDKAAIHENPYVRHLWPLTKSMSARPECPVAGRPIPALSLAFNYAIGAYSVLGYHIFNLVIHILAALTLYGLIKITLFSDRLRRQFGNNAPLISWTAAAIWLVHPLQTESVTYIIQRTESIMGLFYLLTLYTAACAMSSQRPLPWSLLSILCCALGMASKEVMVTAPLLVLLYDRSFAAGSFRDALRRRWLLYIGLAATWIILIAIMLTGPRAGTTGFEMGHITAWSYARTQFGIVVHYIKLCFWPTEQCLDYCWRIAHSWQQIIPPMLLVAAIVAAAFWGLWRNRSWAYPAVWFFVILAPTSTFIPIADLAFEHRLYLPLAGAVILVVAGTYLFLQRIAAQPLKNILTALLIIAVIVSLTLTTLNRNRDYRSEVVVWRNIVKVSPYNLRGYFNLADTLRTEGKIDEAFALYLKAYNIAPDNPEANCNLANGLKTKGRISEAIDHYQRAIRLSPDYPDAHTNLGNALYKLGRVDEAITHYLKAVKVKPNDADLQCNLAIALQAVGRHADAAEHYRQALRFKPDDPAILNNLGFALQSSGDSGQAVTCFKNALRIDPNFVDAHNNLALVLRSQGRFDEALAHFNQALKLKPDFPEAHNNIGLLLQLKGNLDDAVAQFNLAVKLKPDFAEAHGNLALALKSQNKLDEAAEHLNQALKIRPGFAEAHHNLALVLIAQNKPDDAVSHFEQALQAKPDYADAHCNLAGLLARQGSLDRAAIHFRSALAIQPDLLPALKSLAWILATHPDPNMRDTKLAIDLAQQAVELTGRKDIMSLELLATAHAQAGRFDKAVDPEQAALELASAAKDENLTRRISEQLRIYRQRAAGLNSVP